MNVDNTFRFPFSEESARFAIRLDAVDRVEL